MASNEVGPIGPAPGNLRRPAPNGLKRIARRKQVDTIFGGFRVDRDGFQIAHKLLLFQWQDGKKVIVWPEELAAIKARFPTPPGSQRP